MSTAFAVGHSASSDGRAMARAAAGEAREKLGREPKLGIVFATSKTALLKVRLTVEREPIVAIAGARVRPPQVILLDLRLPGLDGFEVLRLLREDERTRDVPVIAVSARDDVQETLALGAAAAFRKPVSLDALFATVEQVVRKNAAQAPRERQDEDPRHELTDAQSVLMADDNEDNRDDASQVLAEGYSVASAGEGVPLDEADDPWAITGSLNGNGDAS